MPTAFISHPDFYLHEMGAHHPERPDRLTAIDDCLIASGIGAYLERYTAPAVTQEQLLRVHSEEHVAYIESLAPDKGYRVIDPDTSMNAHTLSAARHAAGAVAMATDLVMEQKVENAFCSVRPPGHHATRRAAMGFCFYNNVAVGVAQALEQYGLDRVAVVDFDVHHGNGTEDIFADDPRVMVCSTFQHPFYPYSDPSTANEHIINLPLAAGTGSEGFRHTISEHVIPLLENFQPKMLFISAGFDAHREDDMAYLEFTDQDYAWVTRVLKQIAEKYCEGRIVSTLEGGYALSALGRSVNEHLRVLSDI
ncbi:MAG: histone deacetylase family protein [Burkholderiales bacterium]